MGETKREFLSSAVQECRTNHYNQFQEHFRYAPLDIKALSQRIDEDNLLSLPNVIELTHCDEMDRLSEFQKEFNTIKTYDTPLV